MSIWPSYFHLFCLHLHDLALIKIVPRDMQGGGRLVFVFIHILSQGFCSLVWPYFFLCRKGLLVDSTRMLGFFNRICSITRILENLLGRLKYPTEFYEIADTLGGWFKYLNEQLFLSLTGKRKIGDLNDFFVRNSLSHPRNKEVLKALNNIFHLTNELSYLGVLGVKQAPE